jgi:hypothetical protein
MMQSCNGCVPECVGTIMCFKALSVIVLYVAWGGPENAFGQKVVAGVIGGATLTDDFRTETIPAQGNSPYLTFFSNSKDYVVGVLIEVRFPSHLSVEADALYRPLNYEYTGSYTNPGGVGDFSHPSATVLTWESFQEPWPELTYCRAPLVLAR